MCNFRLKRRKEFGGSGGKRESARNRRGEAKVRRRGIDRSLSLIDRSIDRREIVQIKVLEIEIRDHCTMRFKKGSKVEVMSKWEVPLGSWCPAEIISGNGHTYNVRFITCSLDTNLAVGRVPRKAIRPCPPPFESTESWVQGDIVEAFESNSWKLAISWRDGKWDVIQKGYRRCKGVMDSQMKLGNFSPQVPQSCIELEKYGGDDQLHFGRSTCLRELASRSGEKRPNDCLMIIGTSAGAKNKRRLVEKEGKCQPVLLEKVDAVASPYILGERYGVQHAIDEPNDDESIASSVGSCSPCCSPYRSPYCPVVSPLNFNDIEPSCASEKFLCLDKKEDLEEEVHRLELEAYHRTLLALYASGP
uniref:Agenet domain-containing protein n=1 Tax=Ananas comosus var. bracteatus TaxID=296719 RepID=A0A6V7NZK9_ANACO|nr:unnamed protein product [Ananas comosus var. bracteatus]